MDPMGTRFVNPLLKYTLPETNSLSMKIGRAPKGTEILPTINFQGLLLTAKIRLISGCE